jgi:hypothetical protein
MFNIKRLVLEGNFRSLNQGYLPPVSEFPLFQLAVHVPMPYMAQAPPWPRERRRLVTKHQSDGQSTA